MDHLHVILVSVTGLCCAHMDEFLAKLVTQLKKKRKSFSFRTKKRDRTMKG